MASYILDARSNVGASRSTTSGVHCIALHQNSGTCAQGVAIQDSSFSAIHTLLSNNNFHFAELDSQRAFSLLGLKYLKSHLLTQSTLFPLLLVNFTSKFTNRIDWPEQQARHVTAAVRSNT